MRTISIKTKQIIIAILVAVSLFAFSNLASVLGFFKAQAYFYYEKADISIENGDFTSYSRGNETGTPYLLTDDDGWTITKDASVISGVISVNEDDFMDNNSYGLSTNPERAEQINDTTDYYMLMFASKASSHAQAQSESVSLSADKFYEISLFAKTTNNASGSIRMTFDNQSYTSFSNIQYQDWREYKILIATDSLSKNNLVINLGFDSSNGTDQALKAVFYDNIKIYEISNQDFESTLESTNLVKIDLSDNRPNANSFNNSNFETGDLSGFEASAQNDSINVLSTDEINSKIKTAFPDVTGYPARTFVYGNQYSLLLLNQESATSTVKNADNNLITIPQHSFYQLSLLLKTGNLSGDGVTIKLVPDNGDLSEDDTNYISTLEITNQKSDDGIENINGFSKITMYIKGAIDKESSFGIEISLGNGSGWAIIDDITLTPISSAEIGTTNILDFSSAYSNVENISNGDFNLSDNQDYNLIYPLKPQDWTFTSNSGDQGGIIRVEDKFFVNDSKNFGNPINPGYNNAYYPYGAPNENVLMIRNNNQSEAYFTSDSIDGFGSNNNSESNNISKIQVGVNTQNASAFIRLVDKDGKVVASLEHITTNGKWEMQYIYVKNGISSLTDYKLILGVNGGENAFAFFDSVDNVTVEEELTIKDMTGDNCCYVDFATNSFSSFAGFSDYQSSESNFSVISTTTRPNAPDDKVLQINNIDGYQTVISDYSYSLNADNYYEISVWIKTNIIEGNGGAYFEIVNIDSDGKVVVDEDNENTNKFVNIVTQANNETNGYTKYSMYLLAKDSITVKVLLGLGTEDNSTSGSAYFDDLTVQQVDEEDYANITANETTIVSDVIEITTDDETEDTTNPDELPVNIWILASSILLVLALIFAIAGVLIRRIPKKKQTEKFEKTEYSKTTDDVNELNLKTNLKLKREENLSRLKLELENLQKEYEALKQEYEQNTQTNEDTDNKLYKEFTKKSNKLIDRIEYINSAIVYLEDENNAKIEERRGIKRAKEQEHLKDLNKEDGKKETK